MCVCGLSASVNTRACVSACEGERAWEGEREWKVAKTVTFKVCIC